MVSGSEKLAFLVNLLQKNDFERVLIFGNRKDRNSKLQYDLAQYGIECELLSGDISQEKRLKILENFRAGSSRVVIATDVAARGIHVDNVSLVVNFDLPEHPEDYVHRIGRTGRAKREGASYLFYTKDEQKRVDTLLRLTRNTDDCRSVHFDFNHEKLVVEEKQNVDKFNIKCYF